MSLENPTVQPVTEDEITLAIAAFAAQQAEIAAQIKAAIDNPAPQHNQLATGELLLLAKLAGNPQTLADLNACLNFPGLAAKLVSSEGQPKLQVGKNIYIIQPDSAGNLYALIDTESGKQRVYVEAKSAQWKELTSGLEREATADPGYLRQFYNKTEKRPQQPQLTESLQGILQRIIEAMQQISTINKIDAFAIQIIEPHLIACLQKVDHTNNAVEYCITPRADSIKLEIFVANRKTHTRKPLEEFIIN